MLRLVDEAWRHAKAIGAWDGGATVLELAGVAGTPGVVSAGAGVEALTTVRELLATHRAWHRFPTSIA